MFSSLEQIMGLFTSGPQYGSPGVPSQRSDPSTDCAASVWPGPSISGTTVTYRSAAYSTICAYSSGV